MGKGGFWRATSWYEWNGNTQRVPTLLCTRAKRARLLYNMMQLCGTDGDLGIHYVSKPSDIWGKFIIVTALNRVF
jgi:hypothetical protein